MYTKIYMYRLLMHGNILFSFVALKNFLKLEQFVERKFNRYFTVLYICSDNTASEIKYTRNWNNIQTLAKPVCINIGKEGNPLQIGFHIFQEHIWIVAFTGSDLWEFEASGKAFIVCLSCIAFYQIQSRYFIEYVSAAKIDWV